MLQDYVQVWRSKEMNNAKKYFNVLRNNENLTLPGLQTLKLIEDELDRLSLNEHINKLMCTNCPINENKKE
jgi:hypothetical protein